MYGGSCLCGAVAFEIADPLEPGIICHCNECRTQSGHVAAATPVQKTALTMTREDGLTWYRASDHATRGFCARCGSKLFWKRDQSPLIHAMLSSVDAPTGAQIRCHVWVSEKGDYYTINDGLTQFEED